MTEESKPALAAERAVIIERLASPLSAELRIALQGQLSVINAKIKAINMTTAARLKADSDRRKVAGHAEAQANAARARANVEKIEDPPPSRLEIVESWIDAVKYRVTAIGAEATIDLLCDGLRALAKDEELPALPDVTLPKVEAPKRSRRRSRD